MDWANPQVDRVVLAAVEFDERVWESRDAAQIAADLVPELQSLAHEAIELLDGLLDHLDHVDHRQHGDRADRAVDWSSLSDITFMARWDIRRRLGNLTTRPGCDRWTILARCSSLRRRIVKSLCEVERARCALLGVSFRFAETCRSDRSIAIATRRAYRAFISGVRSTSTKLEAGQIELSRGLRLGAATIAVLIGQAIYANLRIEDREQLRALQARLFAAARSPDPFSERRVWSDVEAFAELLAGVERRPELIAHDYELICDALARLATLRRGQAIETEWVVRLELLEGRDPQLDDLLDDLAAAPDRVPVGLRPALLALADKLGRTLGRNEPSLAPADRPIADRPITVQTFAN